MSYTATLNVYIYDANGQVITDGNGNSIAVADPDPRNYGCDPGPMTVDQNGLACFNLTDLQASCTYDVSATCTGYVPEFKHINFSAPATKNLTFKLDPA
ncbi:MAG: hypothetical protein IT365_17835 [Candidatus Hydrogenedentes bacterium]|nr:hypothetical protein [Candidatus Hydrogenedentota bacterium]